MESNLQRNVSGTEESMQRTLGELIHCAIENSPYLAGRKVRFETEAGRVVLKGTVGTFFQKQMAQEALRRIDGIREIENQLEVSWA